MAGSRNGPIPPPGLGRSRSRCGGARTFLRGGRSGFAGAFLLNAADGGAEPVFQGLFHLRLVTGAFQHVDGLAIWGQRDVMAGNTLGLFLGRNEIGEQALVAGMGALRVVEVDARERVLEEGGRLPGSPDGTAIAALFEETELKPQYFEDVTLVVGHRVPPGDRLKMANYVPRSPLTQSILGRRQPCGCDGAHWAM